MQEPVISSLERDGILILQLKGKARVEAAQLLQQQLAQIDSNRDLALDWEQAEHIDACVLQVLLAFRKSRSDRQFSLTVDRDNPHVREYLRMSGLSDYFPVRASQPSIPTSERSDA
jgi:anti-anti-sigma factor